MGLIRLAIFALVIWLVWRLFQIRKERSAAGKDKKAISGGKMVRCAHCGTHLPQQNALPLDELWFCCREHREQHNRHE